MKEFEARVIAINLGVEEHEAIKGCLEDAGWLEEHGFFPFVLIALQSAVASQNKRIEKLEKQIREGGSGGK